MQPNATIQTSKDADCIMTREHLLQSIGFLKPDRFIKNIWKLGKGNVAISLMSRNPKIDPGETASVKARKSNKIPLQPKQAYSDLWHMEIGYGPCAAIGGIKYTLLFVDSASRY